MSYRNSPPPAHSRKRVGAPLDLGVRALNTFLTCCRGQRMGIFAGSGVGKSVLLSMLARNVDADVSVIGLVGERGARCRNSCRMTSARKVLRVRWWWWRPRTNPH